VENLPSGAQVLPLSTSRVPERALRRAREEARFNWAIAGRVEIGYAFATKADHLHPTVALS
jgi:hypothetical protein